MVNFCNNILSIPPRPGVLKVRIHSIISALRGPNGPLDFETVLPVPPALKYIHHGGQHVDGQYHSHWREQMLPDGSVARLPVYPRVLARYRREYGADNPLDWSVLHWGCKSNADCWAGDWDHHSIRFDTPWTPPREFMQALSRKFPDIQFELRFVEPDEEINGRVIYYRGERWKHETYSMHSDAGIENARLVGSTLSEPEPLTVGALNVLTQN